MVGRFLLGCEVYSYDETLIGVMHKMNVKTLFVSPLVTEEFLEKQDMIDKLAAAAAEGKEKGFKGLPMQLGIEMAAEMIAKIKDEHLCDGVHIMAIGAEKNVPAILEKAGITI